MRKHCFFLCMLLLVLRCSVTAPATELPDIRERGSITLSIPGGNLMLYPVGEICCDSDGISFHPTGDFSQWNGNLADLSSPSLAQNLATYAHRHNTVGTIGYPSADGTVLFSDLNPGLYLLVQSEPAPGYEPMSPFLVSLPKYQDGTYQYHIDANPKFQLTPLPTHPQPSLPQTGQTNWPIPTLGTLGILFCLTGLFFQRKYHG